MFNKNTGLAFLANPLNIQLECIEEFQNRLGGNMFMADANSPFMFLLEAFSEASCAMVQSTDRRLDALYAKRAQTSEDLYKHMSDYDYVGLYSYPSSMMLRLDLNKEYLYSNAYDFNENYKKVVIPKNTIFSLGKYSFGLYYPIEIRFNNHVESIIATYDTTEINPLFKLNTNIVEKMEYTYSEMKMIALMFPIYQFDTIEIEEPLIKGIGFTKKYLYKNKFYAFRAYHYFPDIDTWKELNQTISEDIYDPNIPTIKFKVFPENNEIKFNIPSIYFNNNKIGTKLFIELYTTMGKLEMDIGKISPENIKANFAFNSKSTTKYSWVLKNISTLIMIPETGEVTGGSDGFTYEELRSRVINNSFHTDVLVRTGALENYFKDNGFKILKYLDNITDRIYFCYKTLVDNKNNIIQTTNSFVNIYDDMLEDVGTIIKSIDNSIIILPTTIYKYNDGLKTCIPLTDNERIELANKNKEELIEELNNSIYVKSPFHVHLITDERYPRATSYNLMSPKIKDIFFERENINIASQAIVQAAVIQHLDDGIGGYRVRMSLVKSKDIKDVPNEFFMVYVYTKNMTNGYCGIKATYIGELDDKSVYEFYLNTTYAIKEGGYINITSLDNDTPNKENYINIESVFTVVFLISQNYVPPVSTDSTLLIGLPQKLYEDNVVMTRQNITIQLGHSLHDVIYNIVDRNWSNEVYETYEYDVYQTYKQDEPERDENGSIIIEIINNKPIVSIAHYKDEIVVDEFNNPMLAHAKGEIKLDAYGKPVVKDKRKMIYSVDLMQLDYRLFISEHPSQINYKNTMISTFEKYFNSIRSISPALIEQTKIYFRPIRTLGTASFGIGDGVQLRRALTLVFNIKCFVYDYVYKSTDLQNSITETIISIIENSIINSNINMTELANLLKIKLNEYITHIDILGIDDNVKLQTLFIINNDVQLSLEQELYLTKDNLLALRKKINIQYVTE